jgi:catechol-2,3-dioxygenase
MSLFKQFTHVSVTVTDVAKAREFYSDTLGFEEIPRPAFNFPDGNMIEFIGASKKAGTRVMQAAGAHGSLT